MRDECIKNAGGLSAHTAGTVLYQATHSLTSCGYTQCNLKLSSKSPPRRLVRTTTASISTVITNGGRTLHKRLLFFLFVTPSFLYGAAFRNIGAVRPSVRPVKAHKLSTKGRRNFISGWNVLPRVCNRYAHFTTERSRSYGPTEYWMDTATDLDLSVVKWNAGDNPPGD